MSAAGVDTHQLRPAGLTTGSELQASDTRARRAQASSCYFVAAIVRLEQSLRVAGILAATQDREHRECGRIAIWPPSNEFGRPRTNLAPGEYTGGRRSNLAPGEYTGGQRSCTGGEGHAPGAKVMHRGLPFDRCPRCIHRGLNSIRCNRAENACDHAHDDHVRYVATRR